MVAPVQRDEARAELGLPTAVSTVGATGWFCAPVTSPPSPPPAVYPAWRRCTQDPGCAPGALWVSGAGSQPCVWPRAVTTGSGRLRAGSGHEAMVGGEKKPFPSTILSQAVLKAWLTGFWLFSYSSLQ